jgi:coproporphyrinogen III oxidase-like Fe-S oxidoreductase
MLIDAFIAWFMRQKSRSYLTFEDTGRIEPPTPPKRPIHLYIHIPFCIRLCPYCSFHRIPFEEGIARKYFTALREELRMYHRLGFLFSGVYIGGGTPTILMDEILETLDLLHELFAPNDISIETNPDRLARPVISALVDAGVGRVSVGVQTFDDTILKLIGRYEKYGSGAQLQAKIIDVIGMAKTLNIDMIYNFPVQEKSQLLSDLAILDSIRPDQITFYPLMVSDATRNEMTKTMGKRSLAKESRFYKLISSSLSPEYRASSAWCFSKGGAMIDEYIVNNDEYVGTGSGAFGLVKGAIYANTFSIPLYIDSIAQGRLPIHARKAFSLKELARYTFLMDLFSLRMDRNQFKHKLGKDVWQMLSLECLFFSLIGALSMDSRFLRVTPRGQYYWVIMMREFFIGVDNFRDLGRSAVG